MSYDDVRFKIPLISLFGYRKSPDLAIFRQRPKKTDFYYADMLHAKSIAGKSDAVTVGREFYTGKPIGFLKHG